MSNTGTPSPRPKQPGTDGTSAPATAMTITVVADPLRSSSQSVNRAGKPIGTSSRSSTPAAACTQKIVFSAPEAFGSRVQGSSAVAVAQATAAKCALHRPRTQQHPGGRGQRGRRRHDGRQRCPPVSTRRCPNAAPSAPANTGWRNSTPYADGSQDGPEMDSPVASGQWRRRHGARRVEDDQ
ncbi:hypothetical protein AB0L59_37820 [Streptomyces sp. NPDC052109]|uniref:hypothetical protein n=1 Tax=Streptomyces sp. NPDC052109 TaxID=3155527 RepID=UPI003416764C